MFKTAGHVLAQRAKDMGYAGYVINGCVRDVSGCARIRGHFDAVAALLLGAIEGGVG